MLFVDGHIFVQWHIILVAVVELTNVFLIQNEITISTTQSSQSSQFRPHKTSENHFLCHTRPYFILKRQIYSTPFTQHKHTHSLRLLRCYASRQSCRRRKVKSSSISILSNSLIFFPFVIATLISACNKCRRLSLIHSITRDYCDCLCFVLLLSSLCVFLFRPHFFPFSSLFFFVYITVRHIITTWPNRSSESTPCLSGG